MTDAEQARALIREAEIAANLARETMAAANTTRDRAYQRYWIAIGAASVDADDPDADPPETSRVVWIGEEAWSDELEDQTFGYKAVKVFICFETMNAWRDEGGMVGGDFSSHLVDKDPMPRRIGYTLPLIP